MIDPRTPNPSQYVYKMVQIPPVISVPEAKHRGSEAAAYLESIVNRMAAEGWDFHRVDPVGVHIQPGCLSFGSRAQQMTYFVVTFRRVRQQ